MQFTFILNQFITVGDLYDLQLQDNYQDIYSVTSDLEADIDFFGINFVGTWMGNYNLLTITSSSLEGEPHVFNELRGGGIAHTRVKQAYDKYSTADPLHYNFAKTMKNVILNDVIFQASFAAVANTVSPLICLNILANETISTRMISVVLTATVEVAGEKFDLCVVNKSSSLFL